MDRSNENIKKLLDKYWAGESSLADEKMIFSYFASGEVAPEFIEFIPLFSYINNEKDTAIDITSNVLEKIQSSGDKSNQNGIDSLLEKYWAGDSSLEDEQILHLYFSQNNIAPNHKELVPFFTYLKNEKAVSIDVTDTVMKKINTLPVETKVIQLGWRRIISIAASIALVLSVSLAVFQYQQLKKTELTSMDTYQTPEEALEQTKAALAYLSARMNRGTDKALDGISKTKTLEIINQ